MMKKQKIISLWPAATEMLIALGLSDCLVGRSHHCTYQGNTHQLPVCFQPNLVVQPPAPSRPSFSPPQSAHGAWRLDTHLIESLQATHIVFQDQCRHCPPHLAFLPQSKGVIEPVRMSVGSLRTVSESFFCLGHRFGRIFQAENLMGNMRTRWHLIEARSHEQNYQPTVIFLTDIEPFTLPGHWLPQLIRAAGAHAMCITEHEHQRIISPEELLAVNPDFLVFLPANKNHLSTEDISDRVFKDPRLRNLKALFKGRVYRLNHPSIFHYPGPEISTALEILAEIFHERAFEFNHRNHHFERVSA